MNDDIEGSKIDNNHMIFMYWMPSNSLSHFSEFFFLSQIEFSSYGTKKKVLLWHERFCHKKKEIVC